MTGGAQPPWLPLLRRMHAVADAGIEKAVRAEERRRGARRACRRGCSVCCRHQSDVPALPIELTGISWHCAEGLTGASREAVRARLAAHARGGPCPFLVDDSCAVHPVRPLACRLFTVFGRPCAEGEDPFHVRRADLLTPPAGLLARAYREMLPFHGVTEPADQEQWLQRRLVDALAVNLMACDWRTLTALMDRAARPGKSSLAQPGDR
ncbi:MAG TPA: YkgJ family cysteine cluster protein [bacterium]